MAYNWYDELYGSNIDDTYGIPETGDYFERFNQPDPTPPATPWEAPVEEETGGGGGGGYAQNPYIGDWVNRMFQPGGFFSQWAKGGYGYDPEWMRQQQVAGEDLINEWANRMTEQANLDLVGTGRFYSPGTRQGYYRDIDEARLQRLGDLQQGLSQAQLESQYAGRQAWLQALLGAIAGEREYELGLGNLGVARGQLGLAEQGYYGDMLTSLLGMFQ